MKLNSAGLHGLHTVVVGQLCCKWEDRFARPNHDVSLGRSRAVCFEHKRERKRRSLGEVSPHFKP